jgi:hypothetical protein
LTWYTARGVRCPPDYQPPDGAIPDVPEAIAWPGSLAPTFTKQLKEGLWEFETPSPVDSPWAESRTLHGQALGPADARRAVLVLHGGYSEYVPCQMLARPFVRQGFRALIPAAPGHLERSPKGTANGAVFFWSPESVVLGLAQWLAEIHGLVQWLRREGVQTVGLIGQSIGSLAAGLAATLWRDLDFVALLAPVGHHLQAIQQRGLAAKWWPWMTQVTADQSALLDRWAPIFRRPVAPRLLFLVPQFDILQPTVLQEAWWEAWDRPPKRQYRHGHISVCFSPQLYRDLGELAADLKLQVVAVQPAS